MIHRATERIHKTVWLGGNMPTTNASGTTRGTNNSAARTHYKRKHYTTKRKRKNAKMVKMVCGTTRPPRPHALTPSALRSMSEGHHRRPPSSLLLDPGYRPAPAADVRQPLLLATIRKAPSRDYSWLLALAPLQLAVHIFCLGDTSKK